MGFTKPLLKIVVSFLVFKLEQCLGIQKNIFFSSFFPDFFGFMKPVKRGATYRREKGLGPPRSFLKCFFY